MAVIKTKRKFNFFNFIHSDNVTGYVFISLWLIGFFGFTIYPAISSLFYSFTKFDALSPPVWVGLENYIRIFTTDERFRASFFTTLFYVVVYVPLRLAFALLVAMFFKRSSKIISAYRTAYYIPSVIGGSVAVSVMWRQIFGYQGILNQILVSLGFITKAQMQSWIGGQDTALWTLIILAVWQFGSPMLIFLAGLKEIPASLYEAADVDGANGIQKFIKITLPSLSSVIFFNLIMQLISGFMTFTQAYIITEGGPSDKTLLYVLYLYQKSFQYQEMGYGSALAWVLLVFVGLITASVFRSSSYWVYYESKGKM